jgi:uncharacterized protein YkwD
MRFLFNLLLTCCSAAVFSQNEITPADAKIYEKANTAQNAQYLNSKEKLVIYYINVLRLDPGYFSETYLKKYLDSTKENDTYTKTLFKTLAKTNEMSALQPQEDLFLIAKSHAVRCGRENKMGHGNFRERMRPVSNKYKNYLAENCDYGSHSALEIVMELLIDTGIKDLGHRKNILNPKYENIAVSIQPHKRFKQNCVIDFGGTAK